MTYSSWTGYPAVSAADVTCGDCGYEFRGQVETENGLATIVPEECPHCGESGSLSAADVDPLEEAYDRADRDRALEKEGSL